LKKSVLLATGLHLLARGGELAISYLISQIQQSEFDYFLGRYTGQHHFLESLSGKSKFVLITAKKGASVIKTADHRI
jgi:hypothetical protein